MRRNPLTFWPLNDNFINTKTFTILPSTVFLVTVLLGPLFRLALAYGQQQPQQTKSQIHNGGRAWQTTRSHGAAPDRQGHHYVS